MKKLKIGVIGAGYWGPNLIRNFSACPLTEVAAVCDSSPERLDAIGRSDGHLSLVGSLDELLEMKLDAVAIATPVSTHSALASRCLEAGLDVLVEKPLAASVLEAQALVDLADRCGRILMVDHTYLFSGAIRRIKELIEGGELGDLYYVDSIRINLGLFQRDINVIWDLAPHDLSIVDYLIGREARSISASGCAHADRNIEDVAYVNVDYDDQFQANIQVNWLSPVKVRQMIFAGSRKSLIFNELNLTEPIKIYDRGINLNDGDEERHKQLVSYRLGDVWSPHIDPGEALQGVVSHFAECIRHRQTPLSDGRLGLRVVRQLEAATRSIRAQGGRVVLSHGASANGHAAPREVGPDQRSPAGAGRNGRAKRPDVLLR
ncbi:MAG: iolX 2 [Planctomycetota bacterium]|nr:iolX 2 [Planctomycetota bacterium]